MNELPEGVLQPSLRHALLLFCSNHIIYIGIG